MTDDIRKAAIEAAAAQLHGYIAPQLAQEAVRDAIAAYERAMWRPIEEAPEFVPFDTSPETVLLTDGRHVVRGRAGRSQFGAHAQPDSDAGWMPPASVKAFRPLPLPPENET